MGCNSSSAAKPKIDADRRRLSVGNVDSDTQGNAGKSDVEENRGVITSLNQENIVAMLANDNDAGGGRKFSIGSTQDQQKQSFGVKKMQQYGEAVDPSQVGLGYTCRKGLKPESPNQDSWSVLKVDGDFSIYGVFDGHGKNGHDVSNFVKENLPKLIIRDQRFKSRTEMSSVLTDAFKKCQSLIATCDRMKQLDAQLSGTTASIAVHDHQENKLYLAHVADSTCVLASCKQGSNKRVFEATQLTRDHKPDLPDEKARITKAGGRVVFDGYANHRIYAKSGRYPGLNMSRCLGDLLGHQDCGITAEPECSERVLTPDDHVLLLCSDGVWEFVTPAEAVTIIGEFNGGKAMPAADRLAKESWDRWIKEEGGAVVDDITVVLVFLQHAQKSGS